MKNRVLLPIQLDDIDNYNLNKLSKTPARLESIDKLFEQIKPTLNKVEFEDKEGNPVEMTEFTFKKLANFLVYGNAGIINRVPFLRQMKKEIVLFSEMEKNPSKLCKVVNNNEVKKLFNTSIDNFINAL